MLSIRRRRSRPAALACALIGVLTTLLGPQPAVAAPTPWGSYGTFPLPGASMPCRTYLEARNGLSALFLGCDGELRLYTPDGGSQVLHPGIGFEATATLTLRPDGSMVDTANGWPIWSTGPQPVRVTLAELSSTAALTLSREDGSAAYVTAPVDMMAMSRPGGPFGTRTRQLRDYLGYCYGPEPVSGPTRRPMQAGCSDPSTWWRFTAQPDGTWSVTNTASALCLTTPPRGYAPTLTGCVTGSADQRWRVRAWIRPATGSYAYALFPVTRTGVLRAGYSPTIETSDDWDFTLFSM